VKISAVKKLFVGSPLATAQARHERLSRTSALAVFSSDALSSVAYATEEILLVLILAGTAALSFSIPIGIAIALLIAVVVSSYRQTILAYPQGAAPTSSPRTTWARCPRSWRRGPCSSTTCSRWR